MTATYSVIKPDKPAPPALSNGYHMYPQQPGCTPTIADWHETPHYLCCDQWRTFADAWAHLRTAHPRPTPIITNEEQTA